MHPHASGRPVGDPHGVATFTEGAAAELFQTPVRRAYDHQRRTWRRRMGAWFHRIERGAAGLLTEEERVGALSALLRSAEEGTTFYPAHFARAGVSWRDLRRVSDLAHFPFLRRRDVQHAGPHALMDARLTGLELSDGWFSGSSGSTGEPVRFFIDAASIHFFAPFVRFLWGRLIQKALPEAGSAGVALLCTLPRSGVYRCWMPLFRWTEFRKLHWAEPDAGAWLAAANPPVVTGDPHSLAVLADRIEAGLAARPALVLSSSFAWDPSERVRLAERTGAAVVDYYSMAETGPIAWRCERADAFHVLHGAVELEVDAGELVVTNLRNRLFPLVRWRTGDLGEVTDGACACGFRGRSIAKLSGRVASRFVSAAGVRVDPARLHPVLSFLPLRRFQLVQEAPTALLLRYDAEEALSGDSLAPLSEAATRLLGGRVDLRLERVQVPMFRPGEKPLPFLSLLA